MQVFTACACQDLQMRQPALADSSSCLHGIAQLLSVVSIQKRSMRQLVPTMAAVRHVCSAAADSEAWPRTTEGPVPAPDMRSMLWPWSITPDCTCAGHSRSLSSN